MRINNFMAYGRLYSMEPIFIDIKNVQCIKEANRITIYPNALNIKFGFNGLGKSSIGKAINSKIKNEGLSNLRPYTGGEPSVVGVENFKSVLYFSKDFVKQYLFSKKELISKNNTDILINSPDVIKLKEEIYSTKNLFFNISNQDGPILEYINRLEDLLKETLHGNKSISSKSDLSLVFQDNSELNDKYKKNEYYNQDYADKSDYFDWIQYGHDSFFREDKCPYCLAQMEHKQIDLIENLLKLLKSDNFKQKENGKNLLKEIYEFSYTKYKNDIYEIIKKDGIGLTDNDKKILNEQLSCYVKEVNNYNKLRENISLFDTSVLSQDLTKLNERTAELNDYAFPDPERFKNSEDTKELYKALLAHNDNIKKFGASIAQYIDSLSKYNKLILDAIGSNKKLINNFLKISGMNYEFDITEKNGVIKPIIKPVGEKLKLYLNIEDHLSYGEQNSFALALFGAIAQIQKPDLVILDDPISSFDENKKFALMHYFFNENNGVLNGSTVLMLTHDIEPVLDIFKGDQIIKNNSIDDTIFCHLCLLKNVDGVIAEQTIDKKNIISCIVQENNAILMSSNDLLKVIHYRKFLELTKSNFHKLEGGYTEEYWLQYNMLSSAEKFSVIPKIKKYLDNTSKFISMSSDETKKAETLISKYIANFNYNAFVKKFNNLSTLLKIYKTECTNDNDKLSILRMILNRPELEMSLNDVDANCRQFITRTYHISNNYLFLLDGNKVIPDYIMHLCNSIVKNIEESFNS